MRAALLLLALLATAPVMEAADPAASVPAAVAPAARAQAAVVPAALAQAASGPAAPAPAVPASQGTESPAGAAGSGAAAAAPSMEGAVAAYRAGRYGEAMRAFAALAAAEADADRAGVLHGNAGTAAARANRVGEAIWQLRRARQLLPRDAVVATNLERVQSLLGASDSETGQFARTLRELPLHLTPDESRLVCAAAAGLALLLLAAWRAGRAPRAVTVLAGVLLVGAAAWWWCSRVAWERDRQGAVVIDAMVIARPEPADDTRVQFRLSGGTIVSDEEQRDAWRLVQTAAGARGWVPADRVRPLR